MNGGIFNNIAYWGARISGLFFFTIIAVFAAAHLVSPNGGSLEWPVPFGVLVDFLALILMAAGCVVGWKSPPVAAVMILVGYALWRIVEREFPWPPTLIEIPLLSGLLFLLAWWHARRRVVPK
jgi:hypothetical protein